MRTGYNYRVNFGNGQVCEGFAYKYDAQAYIDRAMQSGDEWAHIYYIELLRCDEWERV